MNKQKVVRIVLRVSIASVFLYAAVASFLEPDVWVVYLPGFVTNLLPSKELLLGFSAYQLGLAVWILSGWKGFYAGLLSALTLIGIIVANVSLIDIVFRDIAIFFAAVALTVDSKE